MDAWALTDHGNANGHAHAFTYSKDVQDRGRTWKFIPGVEFYLHPDLVEWKREWIAAKERKAKLAKRAPADDDGGGGFEDEEETKQTKWYDPVKRRHHLVVLAKNRTGLENLYTLITRSYDEGFYRFPRIDYRMLAEHHEGLVVSTACIGGPMAYDVMRHHQDVEWDDMLPHVGTQETFETIQRDLANVAGRLQECVGVGNFFLELQFNRLGVQHLVNRHLIELSHRTNIPLIATADSHYPGPGLWKDRELYKKLGWLNYDKYEPGMLPTSTDELKAQLYPKNATQMWDAYWDSRDFFEEQGRVKDWSFYDDQEVSDAIERSYDIAHELCVDARPETKHLFAASIVPDDPKTGDKMDPFHALVAAVQEGMRRRGLEDKQEYIDRARDELQVIKEKDFALYFLTMAKVMNIATDHMLVGPGRGCFLGETEVITPNGSRRLDQFQVGDKVIDADENTGEVIDVFEYDVAEALIELEFDDGVVITCTQDHKFLVDGRGWVPAYDLRDDDDIVDVSSSTDTYKHDGCKGCETEQEVDV